MVFGQMFFFQNGFFGQMVMGHMVFGCMVFGHMVFGQMLFGQMVSGQMVNDDEKSFIPSTSASKATAPTRLPLIRKSAEPVRKWIFSPDRWTVREGAPPTPAAVCQGVGGEHSYFNSESRERGRIRGDSGVYKIFIFLAKQTSSNGTTHLSVILI
jgi:hypothetical protein